MLSTRGVLQGEFQPLMSSILIESIQLRAFRLPFSVQLKPQVSVQLKPEVQGKSHPVHGLNVQSGQQAAWISKPYAPDST